ncbi:MAG: hypothetical protein OHK0023_07800 [Anaerolineae bacterium]
MFVVNLVLILLGVWIVIVTISSAIRTFILPRTAKDKITRIVFRNVRRVFRFWVVFRRAYDYLERDRINAMYAPVALFALPFCWFLLIAFGYTLIYFGLGVPLEESIRISGSSITTLGVGSHPNIGINVIMFTEGALGMLMIALLISYLPTIYSAFSKREVAVTMLETRAGSPPSSLELILRYHNLNRIERLSDLWVTWEQWFAELEESHSSLTALVFYRSPTPHRHWLTAAGTILDTAALYTAVLDVEPKDVQAQLCIRAGFLALRHIADFFRVDHDKDPKPTDPISIRRSEFDEVYERLKAEHVPVKVDQEQAWRDFAGWRVNYDTVLIALAMITLAPPAHWVSDRSLLRFRSASRNMPVESPDFVPESPEDMLPQFEEIKPTQTESVEAHSIGVNPLQTQLGN